MGSPPSRASTQYSSWSAVARQLTRRGPSATPWVGTSSARGSEATVATRSPSSSHTSTSLAKRHQATSCDHGATRDSTRR